MTFCTLFRNYVPSQSFERSFVSLNQILQAFPGCEPKTYSTMEPSHGDLEEVLLNCRYGELEELQAFVEKFGWKPINEVRDESGNTILHMICGNGHLGASRLYI